MGERFGADVADCSDVDVCRDDEGVWKIHVGSLGVNAVNYRLD
jgi:hypothetical protein